MNDSFFRTQNITAVHFYRYRTARVSNIIFDCQLVCGSDNDIAVFREILAEKAGRPIDNHTVYKVYYGEHYLYFQFSDWKMYVGFNVIVGEY